MHLLKESMGILILKERETNKMLSMQLASLIKIRSLLEITEAKAYLLAKENGNLRVCSTSLTHVVSLQQCLWRKRKKKNVHPASICYHVERRKEIPMEKSLTLKTNKNKNKRKFINAQCA